MPELYEVVTVENKQYVRKERLDELQHQFDTVCQAHTEFVDKVYTTLLNGHANGCSAAKG